MLPLLDAEEVRVLGSLIEKEATTPEYYPMSLNALVNACNQKSNRHPAVSYDEEIVLQAIERLRDKKMAAVIVGGGRVNKYAQRFSELLNLGRRRGGAAVHVVVAQGSADPGRIGRPLGADARV